MALSSIDTTGMISHLRQEVLHSGPQRVSERSTCYGWRSSAAEPRAAHSAVRQRLHLGVFLLVFILLSTLEDSATFLLGNEQEVAKSARQRNEYCRSDEHQNNDPCYCRTCQLCHGVIPQPM